MSNIYVPANNMNNIENELLIDRRKLIESITEDQSCGVVAFAERLEDDPGHLLITFLWKDSEAKKDEEIIGSLLCSSISNSKLEKPMKRLEGTNILYTTYKVSNSVASVAYIEKRFAIKSLRYRVNPMHHYTSGRLM